ncbi:hypothetical protein ACG7TL_009274 [Trametes sanguinea]
MCTEETKATSEPAGTKRGWRFWVIFVALCLSLFLTALDLASVYTALPSIIHDLQGADSFVWVSSAYTLSCSAVLPMSGRLADIFGRRIILLVSIVLFAVGSTVTAAAHTMSTVIIGRTIQGVASGAIQVLVAIVTADLIPLKDRGFFQSITGATQPGDAFFVVFLFLHLRKPPVESYKEAFLSVDWIGNTIIIASATSCIIGLTWAGLQHPWSSAQVIAPLVIGVAGLFGALVYDAYVAAHPVAAKLATPLLSGLYIFPTAICISPAAIVQGILVSKTGKYRLISLVGWCGMTIGVGLLTLLKPDTPVAVTVPFQVIAAIGFGFVYATTFSVLAPLPPTQNAAALSFLLFMRTFSSAWASSISGTIFQNRLHALLPTEFLTRLPHDQDVTYSGIPLIPGLEEPLRDEVRAAFADSVRLVWYICLGLCAAGFVSVAMQKHVPLHAKMDDRFGMKEKAQARCKDMEMGESKQSDADVPAQAAPLLNTLAPARREHTHITIAGPSCAPVRSVSDTPLESDNCLPQTKVESPSTSDYDRDDKVCQDAASKTGTVWTKLDLIVLPLVTTIYFLSSLDRSNIGNARIAGLQRQLHMSDDQEGLFTVLFGASCYFMLPDTPSQIPGLSSKERDLVVLALREDGIINRSEDDTSYTLRNCIRTFSQPHVLLVMITGFLNGSTLSGLAYIVAGLGYSGTRAQLMSVPPFAVAAVPSHVDHIRYGSLFLLVPGTYCIGPPLGTWAANNSAPLIRRATALALLPVMTNLGSILSTWLLGAISPAPRYTSATITLLAFQVGIIACAVLNMLWLAKENRRKQYERDNIVPVDGQAEHDITGEGDDCIWFEYVM